MTALERLSGRQPDKTRLQKRNRREKRQSGNGGTIRFARQNFLQCPSGASISEEDGADFSVLQPGTQQRGKMCGRAGGDANLRIAQEGVKCFYFLHEEIGTYKGAGPEAPDNRGRAFRGNPQGRAANPKKRPPPVVQGRKLCGFHRNLLHALRRGDLLDAFRIRRRNVALLQGRTRRGVRGASHCLAGRRVGTGASGARHRARRKAAAHGEKGLWMGARTVSANGASDPETCWALMGATVAPSFEYADFTKGNAEEIARLCPERAALIRALG